MPLTATGTEVFVATTTTVILNRYASLEDTLNYLKYFKLKDRLGENVAELCAAILVDAEHLRSDGDFKLEHL